MGEKQTMKTRMIPFLAFCLLVGSMGAFAGESTDVVKDEAAMAEGVTSADHEGEEASANHTHWDFLACVHSSHECKHEASHHGYPHYKAVHDHHRCPGHRDLACYGGHH